MKPIDTPRALVRSILAMRAVGLALAFVPLIRLQSGSQEGAALYGALCVYYARAFTNNRGLGALSPKVVPGGMEQAHARLLVYRNKIAAHSDSEHEHDGTSVNGVFFRSDGRQLMVEDRHLCPTPEFIAEVEALLQAVRSRLSMAVGDCLNQGPPSMTPLSEGLYLLAEEGRGDWSFLQVEDDGLAD